MNMECHDETRMYMICKDFSAMNLLKAVAFNKDNVYTHAPGYICSRCYVQQEFLE